MQILGFGGVGRVRSGGGYHWGGGCGGPGTGLIYIDTLFWNIAIKAVMRYMIIF